MDRAGRVESRGRGGRCARRPIRCPPVAGDKSIRPNAPSTSSAPARAGSVEGELLLLEEVSSGASDGKRIRPRLWRTEPCGGLKMTTIDTSGTYTGMGGPTATSPPRVSSPAIDCSAPSSKARRLLCLCEVQRVRRRRLRPISRSSNSCSPLSNPTSRLHTSSHLTAIWSGKAI